MIRKRQVGIDLGSRWKMLSVPVGFEIRIDFAVNDENPKRALRDPRPYRLEVGERAHRRAARAIAAGNGREIRFRELHDVDRKALAAEIMHLGRVRTVVVDRRYWS
jgi:hypothetical protein